MNDLIELFGGHFMREVPDPYPAYQRLRQTEPVKLLDLPMAPGYMVTRYDDVLEVLKHLRFSADRRRARNRFVQAAMEQQAQAGPFAQAQTMLSSDPPQHTRLRGLVSKAFTFKAIEAMRPQKVVYHGTNCGASGR